MSIRRMKEAIVRQQYDQKADIYDRRWSGYLTKTLSLLGSWAQISPSESVLDVACGTGELERLLLQDNPQQRITGIDISEQMLKIAKQKLLAYPQVFWKKASASELPFGNRSYDVVVCASSFHYFDYITSKKRSQMIYCVTNFPPIVQIPLDSTAN